MKDKEKDSIKPFYILLGIFFLIAYSFPIKKNISEIELVNKKIVVNQEIRHFKGRNKDNIEYRIYSKEYRCAFAITTIGGMASKWKNLDNISKNDTLIIQIKKNRTNDLNNNSADIPIYSLIKNNKMIFDIEAYNNCQSQRDKRWEVIFIISGILFILRGLTIISSNVSYLLVGISILVILVFKYFDKW